MYIGAEVNPWSYNLLMCLCLNNNFNYMFFKARKKYNIQSYYNCNFRIMFVQITSTRLGYLRLTIHS